MANLQDKLAQLFPAATLGSDDSGTPMLTVADADWHSVASTLRDNPDTAMDYLVTIVGMDWTDSLGCIYYMMSTPPQPHSGRKGCHHRPRQAHAPLRGRPLGHRRHLRA